MQWKYHGQINFVFTPADVIRYSAADVQCSGHHRSGKIQWETGIGGGWFNHRLINVFTNLFIGISLGANVLAARFYAMGKSKEMSETVHTSITLAMVSGVIMAFVGVLFARGALELMGTPDDVIDQSTLYMRIYFMGMPFFMLYNYGAAILRAIGDTKRPLLFLIISGLINAALNMLLVIYCHMAVEGVAIATVISQLISCILVLWCLYKSEGSYQLRFSKLQIKGVYLKQIFQVGIPAGIQSMIINFSNVLLQSSVNSFGSTAMQVIRRPIIYWDFSMRQSIRSRRHA